MDYQELAVDMIRRTERAVKQIAELAVDTEITFQVTDIVQRVEDDLPDGYPTPDSGVEGRRAMIARMAKDILSGEAYEDE